MILNLFHVQNTLNILQALKVSSALKFMILWMALGPEVDRTFQIPRSVIVVLSLPPPPSPQYTTMVTQMQGSHNDCSLSKQETMGGTWQSQVHNNSELWPSMCYQGFLLWMQRMCLTRAQVCSLETVGLLGPWLCYLRTFFFHRQAPCGPPNRFWRLLLTYSKVESPDISLHVELPQCLLVWAGSAVIHSILFKNFSW